MRPESDYLFHCKLFFLQDRGYRMEPISENSLWLSNMNLTNGLETLCSIDNSGDYEITRAQNAVWQRLKAAKCHWMNFLYGLSQYYLCLTRSWPWWMVLVLTWMRWCSGWTYLISNLFYDFVKFLFSKIFCTKVLFVWWKLSHILCWDIS